MMSEASEVIKALEACYKLCAFQSGRRERRVQKNLLGGFGRGALEGAEGRRRMGKSEKSHAKSMIFYTPYKQKRGGRNSFPFYLL